ncbi:MAG TPA: hypothetical protein VM282_01900 [Acidimicrobiales bacterium]|nr:hypothetical protein [Acidimicrobiales bacterium]
MRAIYPYEDYMLMRSSRPIVREADGYEHDLFAGIEFDDERPLEAGS